MVTQYGVITTIDSTAVVVLPTRSPIIGGLVGTAAAPVQGSNPNSPGTLPAVNTPIAVTSLMDAYAKGIGAGSLLTALARIYAQVSATIILIRTVDITTAPLSVPFFAEAEDIFNYKANWLAAPGLTYNQRPALPVIGFTSPNGTGAIGLAILNNATGGIDTITVVSGGIGYTTAPVVTITDPDGNGTGAVAVAAVAGGAVTAVTVTTAGTLYGTGVIRPATDLNAVMTALQTEAEHEGILFVADGDYTSMANFLAWLGNNTHDRAINIPNRVLVNNVPIDASGAVLGAIIRNEAEKEVRVELPSRHALRVRTNPSNKIIRGITGVSPHYTYSDRYQSNAANAFRTAKASVITHKEGNWKLWGSDTLTANLHDPLADISVRRVVEQLEDDLDFEFSFFEDEPMTPALVASALERANSVSIAYANAGFMESGNAIINDADTNYNTGDIGIVTEIQIAGVVHRIHNRIHLLPL